MERINICGLSFCNVTMSEALDFLKTAVKEGKQVSVVTPNAEITSRAMEDESYREILNSAELMIPDGIGVINASKILKTPLKEKVAGVELGENLLKYAAEARLAVFFLGGKPGVADTAAAKMTQKYENLTISGVHDGYFSREGDENRAVVEQIAGSGAAILFVCMGQQVQEQWINDNRDKLPAVKILLGLGGSLDVYAGNTKRAPKLFIKLGLEWLWRVIREPWRISRVWKMRSFYGKVKRFAK